MTSTNNTTNSSKSLAYQLGENYEYMKTIAANNITIKKLQLIDVFARVASNIVLSAILFILFSVLALVLTTLSVVALYNLMGSLVMALTIVSGVLLLLMFFVYLFRRQIIYNRLIRATDKMIDQALS